MESKYFSSAWELAEMKRERDDPLKKISNIKKTYKASTISLLKK
jgi:hypothetical protein